MENQNILLDKAYRIACQAHAEQFDKGGRPYIEHPIRVAEGVDTVEEKMTALLHDVLEDSPWTREELIGEDIPESVVEAVCILTHDKETQPDYMEYVKTVSQNPIARRVKMSDLMHNMDISRILDPTQRDFDRLKRYRKAYAFLESIENEN